MSVQSAITKGFREHWKLAVLACITIGIVFGVGFYALMGRHSRQPFDSEAWKKAGVSNACLRKGMLFDLRKKHELTGLSREQIVELLGQPDRVGRYVKAGLDKDFNYDLGAEKGFISIDREWLTIKLESGKVSEVLVTTD